MMTKTQINAAIAEMKELVLRSYDQDHHLHEMFLVMEKMADCDEQETREKLMRWIGFMQGALWTDCYYTIDDLRAMNTKGL